MLEKVVDVVHDVARESWRSSEKVNMSRARLRSADMDESVFLWPWWRELCWAVGEEKECSLLRCSGVDDRGGDGPLAMDSGSTRRAESAIAWFMLLRLKGLEKILVGDAGSDGCRMADFGILPTCGSLLGLPDLSMNFLVGAGTPRRGDSCAKSTAVSSITLAGDGCLCRGSSTAMTGQKASSSSCIDPSSLPRSVMNEDGCSVGADNGSVTTGKGNMSTSTAGRFL
jgi:hypothetical protein